MNTCLLLAMVSVFFRHAVSVALFCANDPWLWKWLYLHILYGLLSANYKRIIPWRVNTFAQVLITYQYLLLLVPHYGGALLCLSVCLIRNLII